MIQQSLLNLRRHATRLLAFLFLTVLGIGQMWAQDPDVTITASEFGTAKSGVTVNLASSVSVSEQQIWKNGSSAVKANIAQIGNSANADYSVYYVEISSTKEIESVDILAVNNQSSGNYAIPVVYWTGAAAAAFDGYQSITIPCKNATVAPTAQHVDVSTVDGVKTLRIYRTIRVNSEGTSFASSNYTTVGDGKTAYIISVAVTFADAGTPCTPLAVNFAAGEGTGTMTAGECCPGKNYTIPTCGFTAPDGKEFDAWTSSPEVTITDGKFTMPDEAVTLTATWKDLPAVPDFVFTKTGKPTSGNLAAGDEIAVTGGTMKVYSTKTETSLKWASDGLNFSGGQADQVIIETDKVFQVGSVISLTFKNNKLDLLDEAGNVVVTQDAPGSTYTVEADDGLEGNNVFRLRRNGSSYLQSIEITGLGSAIATWNVTFDMQGATSAAIEAQSVKNGKKAVKPADPEKTGYNFVKWVVASTDADYNFDATVTADVALKAVWEVQVTKYTVTYAKGDEAVTGDVPTQESLAEGANFTVAGKGDLAWADHKFVGWKDQDDAAVAAGANYTMPAKNVTLTAQWNEAVTYDVTFNLQGHGAAIEAQRVIEGETATKPADPKAELYTFGGWYTEAECTNAFDFATTITAAKELFAKWTAFGEATSINIEQFVIENGKSGDIQAALTAANFDFNLLSGDELDDLVADESKNDKNCAFRGLKLKNNGSYVVGNIPAGKLVDVVIGNLGAAKVQINGADAATALVAGVGTTNKTTPDNYKNSHNYYYSETAAVLKVLSTGTSTTVLKGINIIDPFVVTFANGGEIDPISYKAAPIVLPVATGDGEFQGWFDAETAGTKIGDEGDLYTPTADITLYAQFSAKSTDVTLKTLKYGETSILEADKYTYDVVLPYKSVVPASVTYEANSAVATPAGEQTATVTDGTASFTITAEDEVTTQTYTVNFTNAPKDGVCITKTETTGSKNQTITGVYGDTEAANMVNVASDKKLGGSGQWIGVALVEGQTFTEGDIINIHTTTAGAQGVIAIYSNTGKTATKIADLAAGYGVLGDNKFALPAGVEAYSKLYIARTDANNWNGYVDFVEVTRTVMPTISSVKVGTEDAKAPVENAVEFELLYGSDITAIAPVFTFVTNDNAQATITPAGAQNFATAENNTIAFILTDKDGDTQTINVTVTVAEPEPATLTLVATDGDNYYATFSSESPVKIVADHVYAVNVDGNTLQMNDVVAKEDGAFAIPANTGVLIMNASDEVTYYQVASAAAVETNNLLRAASVAMEGDFKFYKLAYDNYSNKTGLGFYYGAAEGAAFTAKEGGAYLAVPNEIAAPVRFLFHATDTATALENMQVGEQVVKMFIDGQFVIVRDGKCFNAMGQLIK